MDALSSAALSIECSDQPLDIDFHPHRPSVLVAALVDGTLEVHNFAEVIDAVAGVTGEGEVDDDEIDSLVSSKFVHTQLLPSQSAASGTKQAAARCVAFGSAGDCVYSGGTAGDLVCLNAERLSTFSTSQSAKDDIQWSIPNASYQASPLQILKELPGNPNLIVTGDEAGGVRVWDVRLCGTAATASGKSYANITGCVHSWRKHEDYVSGLECSSDGNTLLACSADCTLSVYDLRAEGSGTKTSNSDAERFLRRSDDQEDELLSIKIMKNGHKVVCGTGEGVLCIWSWGTWGDVSDRLTGHPQSIDALLKLDENTLLTGSSDGLIRVVSIHPNKLLGVLGDCPFPVEKLCLSADRRYVASVTHDNVIRLWDSRVLDGDHEDAADTDMKQAEIPLPRSAFNKASQHASDDDWSDMDEASANDDDEMKDSDDDPDSDSDDSDEGDTEREHLPARRFKTDNEKFFEDL